MQIHLIQKFREAIKEKDINLAIKLSDEYMMSSNIDKDYLYEMGNDLWHAGKAHKSKSIFRKAFDLGNRDVRFLQDFVGLLTGEMEYKQIFEINNYLLSASNIEDSYIEMLVGHAQLAMYFNRSDILHEAQHKENGSKWLNTRDLMQKISFHINRKIPFSFVRLGDGEARFMIYCDSITGGPVLLEQNYIDLIGDCVWKNWFGESIMKVGNFELRKLYHDYLNCIKNADVIGVVTAERLRQDTGHFGYLAYQEFSIRKLYSDNNNLCDSMAHYHLNEISPFLSFVFQDIAHFSVSSPHSQLAERLGNYFNIKDYRSYVIPGERRLPEGYFMGEMPQHFPIIYDSMRNKIDVRYTGELFIVAAGLLGKIYCDIIKDKGGIAIDIGSIVDGWMGINTRPGFLDKMRLLPAIR